MDGRSETVAPADGTSSIERLWAVALSKSMRGRGLPAMIWTDGFAAERVIGAWIAFHNTERPHSALDGRTPAGSHSDRAGPTATKSVQH